MKKDLMYSFVVEFSIIRKQSLDCREQQELKQKFFLPNHEALEASVVHSVHSRKRADQRSIDDRTIMQVLTFGTVYYRQGMTFYTVLEKNHTPNLSHHEWEKMKNLVVVLGSDNIEIVTCYYSKNAIKHLKKKQKKLAVRKVA